MAALVRDARLAWRAIARAPGFTVVAVLSLALSIGANSTLFGFLSPLLLRAGCAAGTSLRYYHPS